MHFPISQYFRLAKPTLDFENNDQPLACELLGRLSHLEQQHPMCIKPLVVGARQWYEGTSGLFLIPQRSCFPTPGEPLRTTYTGHRSKYKKAGDLLNKFFDKTRYKIFQTLKDSKIKKFQLV